MEQKRSQRVERELQQLVAQYLVKGFKYPLRGLVSVSRVEVNEKMRAAKIFVTVLGTERDREISLETLQEHVHDIQKHVSSKIRMKFVPRLSVNEDLGLAKMLKLEQTFRDIAEERKKRGSLDEE